MRNCAKFLGSILTEALIFLIAIYQKTISPDHGFMRPWFGRLKCRFYPSCSEYARRSLSQYGLIYGIMLSLKRIFRCGPWSQGGYDPVISLKFKV